MAAGNGKSAGNRAVAMLRALVINLLLAAVPLAIYYYVVVERQSQARTEQGFHALKRIHSEFDTRLLRVRTLMQNTRVDAKQDFELLAGRFAELSAHADSRLHPACPPAIKTADRGSSQVEIRYLLDRQATRAVVRVCAPSPGDDPFTLRHAAIPAASLLDAHDALRRFIKVDLVALDGEVIGTAQAPPLDDPDLLAHVAVPTTVTPVSLRPYLEAAVQAQARTLASASGNAATSAVGKPEDLGEPVVIRAEIAGERYRIFVLPFEPEETLLASDGSAADKPLSPVSRLFLVGIQPQSTLADARAALGVNGLWYLLVALLLMLAAGPLLRVLLQHPQESISRSAIAMTAISMLLVPSLLVIAQLAFAARGSALAYWSDRAAAQAAAVESALRAQIASMLGEIDAIAPLFHTPGAAMPADLRILSCADSAFEMTEHGPADCQVSDARQYRYCHLAPAVVAAIDAPRPPRDFGSLFHADRNGILRDHPHLTWGGCQRRAYALPLGNREYFRSLQLGQGWPVGGFLAAQAGSGLVPRDGRFSAQRIYSRADGARTFVVAIPKTTADGRFDGVYAAVSPARALSAAIDPPFLNYAVVDNGTGSVIFHSDDDNSLQENFFAETGDAPELAAALFSGTPSRFVGLYRGVRHRFVTRPIAGLPWTVVSFHASDAVLMPVVGAALTALASLIGYIGALVLSITLFTFLFRVAGELVGRKPLTWEWLWPQWRLRRHYPWIAAGIGLLTLIEAWLLARLTAEILLGLLVIVITAAIVAAGFVLVPSKTAAGVGIRQRWSGEPAGSPSHDLLRTFRAGYLMCILLAIIAVGVMPAMALFDKALPMLQDGASRVALSESGRDRELRVSVLRADLQRHAPPGMAAWGRYPEAALTAQALPAVGWPASDGSGCPIAASADADTRSPLLRIGAQAIAPLLPALAEAVALLSRSDLYRPGLYCHPWRYGAPFAMPLPDGKPAAADRHGDDHAPALPLDSLPIMLVVLVLIIWIVYLLLRRVLGVDQPYLPTVPAFGAGYAALPSVLTTTGMPTPRAWYRMVGADGALPDWSEAVEAQLAAIPEWQRIDVARCNPALLAADNPLAPLLLTGISRAVLDPPRRLALLALIERRAAQTQAGLLLLAAATPPWLRLCEPDRFPDADLPNADEAQRWRRVQARFASHYQPFEVADAAARVEATGVKDAALKQALADEWIALAELLGREPPQATFAGQPIRDLRDVEDRLLAAALPQFRREWAYCTQEERLQLYKLARGAIPNPLNREVLDDLLIRRIVVLAPEPRIACRSFARFVRSAEPAERFAEWNIGRHSSGWSAVRMPFYILLTLLAVWFAYSFGAQVNTLAAVLTVVVGVLGSVGKVAGFVKGSPDK